MFYKYDHVIKAHTLYSDKITESMVTYNAHYVVKVKMIQKARVV